MRFTYPYTWVPRLRRCRVPLLGAAVLAILVLPTLWPEKKIDFNRDVRPILNSRCLACHGGVKQAGGFSLLFRDDALSKSKSGKHAIVPGEPGKSEMIRRIRHGDPQERMPADGPPLAAEEIRILERWIAQGAEWEDHWAYVPPEPPPVPEVSDEEWPTNGIDHFILARLDEAGLAPNPVAGCATLARRLSLDLIGLPPEPARVEAFCRDTRASAYEAFVDTLLASPRFGEHWAAFWMDLARYADTKGYEKDAHRTIWKYRDWVIGAFNRDLPFDQFTLEQLAGDLIPGATEEQILATAFHRNTPTNDEGGTDNEEFRTAAVLDRVNTTWEVWQGTTMACVQCHSHPYDPFRQTDYYRFLAFFNNTADADWTDEMPRAAVYSSVDEQQIRDILAWMEASGAAPGGVVSASVWERVERSLWPSGRRAASSYEAFEEVYSESEGSWPVKDGAWARYGAQDLTGITEIAFSYKAVGPGGAIEVRIDSPNGPQIAYAELRGRKEHPGQEIARVPVTPTEGAHRLYLIMRRPGEGRFWLYSFALNRDPEGFDPARRPALIQKRLALGAVVPEAEAPVMMELPANQRRRTHVFERGNWLVKGQEVKPGVPGSLNPVPRGVSPDRLGMAKWLTSRENPLTARVAVNRFWAQIFGTGIVETLEDFGTVGLPPSHPELLDYLALRFLNEHRWSVKSLLRQVVTSSTYRQSARVSPDALAKDPFNRLLARFPRVRLSAEQIRDQALAVSGLLSPKMFGPSVMPPQPPGLWNSAYDRRDWQTSRGEDRYRRAVYTYWRRTVPFPSMSAFDSPSRDLCVSRRIRTNTPLQALVTLNDPVYVEASQALARRMEQGGVTPEERIRFGYRTSLGRDPDADALERLVQLYDEALIHYRARPADQRASITPYMPYDTVASRFADPREALRSPAPAPALASTPADPLAVAALGVVATTIMNLDGFLTKE